MELNGLVLLFLLLFFPVSDLVFSISEPGIFLTVTES